MVWLAIVSFLAGAVLGVWFRVPVLLLAVILALAVVIAVGTTEASLSWIVLDVVLVATCLELGYIVGSILEPRLSVRKSMRYRRTAFGQRPAKTYRRSE